METGKTKHGQYQEAFLKPYKKATGLPENASLAQTIEALSEIGQPNEATEMLFGCERNQMARLGCTDFSIFMDFWSNKHPELFKEVVANHVWVQNNQSKGYAIQIYPGEYLLIQEPTATKLLRAIMASLK
jgi:hypothetical protein